MLKHLVAVLALIVFLATPTAGVAGGIDSADAGRAGATIHLNTATAAELEALPGIGPVLAERIVQYRAAHGPFQRLDQLHDVKGVGDHLLRRVEAQLDL